MKIKATTVRMILQQTTLISFFMLMIIGVEGFLCHLNNVQFILNWYIPFSIILVGFLSSLPTLILIHGGEGRGYLVRIILHCLMCYAVVITAGYLFRWYTTFLYGMIVTIMFFVVYALVWVSSILSAKADAKKINAKLDEIRDEE